MKILMVILSAILFAGCATTKDFFKAVEGKAYDAAAKGASKYCKGVVLSSEASPQARALANRERVEVRREIRQRGKYGPVAGDGNRGPIIIIWCEGDPLPDNWERYLDKNP